ncbi:MAG TPA: hypothetical protein VFY38_01925, partial [Pseudonocardia sp.]|nr:hypothetical protein [Pseudonocardia sp.]
PPGEGAQREHAVTVHAQNRLRGRPWRSASATRSLPPGDLTERDAPADTIAAAIGAYHAS